MNLQREQQINLLSSEQNIFFSIDAQRMATHLKDNNLDCHILKDTWYVRFLRMPGTIIWHQIQAANKEGNGHVEFHDLIYSAYYPLDSL